MTLINRNMKKIAVLAAVACAFSMSACNNNSSMDKNNDGDTTLGEHLDHSMETTDESLNEIKSDIDADLQAAEERAQKAQADLDEAVENGDEQAAAQKALDEANEDWEKTKEAQKIQDKIKEGAGNAVDATKELASVPEMPLTMPQIKSEIKPKNYQAMQNAKPKTSKSLLRTN